MAPEPFIPSNERQRRERSGFGPPKQSVQATVSILGSFLYDTLRETDLVAYAGENRLYIVLLPEASATEAEQAVRRLDRLLSARTESRLRAGLAKFPADGFTIQDLRDRAQLAWQSHPIVLDKPILTDEAANA